MLNIPKVLLHYVLKCLILCEEYIYIYILCLNVVRLILDIKIKDYCS